MNTENTIIENEGLIGKVTYPLADLRQGLIDKGYTEEEADTAIAGALPWYIALAAIKRGKKVL